MPASSRGSVALLLALSLVWGSSWIANEMLRDQCGPLQLAMLRYVLAAFFVASALCVQQIYHRLRRGGMTRPARNHSLADHKSPPQLAGQLSGGAAGAPDHGWIVVSVLLGCTMFVLPDLLLIWSGGHGAAAWTPMIYAGLPLVLLLTAGELRMPAVLGVGAMLILLNGSLPLTASKLLWVLPIAVAVLLQGWSLVYAQRHCAAASSLRGVIVQMVTAALLLWASVRVSHEVPGAQSPLCWPVSSRAALCLLAGLATAIAYPLYYQLLEKLEPAQLVVSEWLQTLVAISESAALLHHRPGWPMVGASAVLIGCAVLLLQGENARADSILRLPS